MLSELFRTLIGKLSRPKRKRRGGRERIFLRDAPQPETPNTARGPISQPADLGHRIDQIEKEVASRPLPVANKRMRFLSGVAPAPEPPGASNPTVADALQSSTELLLGPTAVGSAGLMVSSPSLHPRLELASVAFSKGAVEDAFELIEHALSELQGAHADLSLPALMLQECAAASGLLSAQTRCAEHLRRLGLLPLPSDRMPAILSRPVLPQATFVQTMRPWMDSKSVEHMAAIKHASVVHRVIAVDFSPVLSIDWVASTLVSRLLASVESNPGYLMIIRGASALESALLKATDLDPPDGAAMLLLIDLYRYARDADSYRESRAALARVFNTHRLPWREPPSNIHLSDIHLVRGVASDHGDTIALRGEVQDWSRLVERIEARMGMGIPVNVNCSELLRLSADQASDIVRLSARWTELGLQVQFNELNAMTWALLQSFNPMDSVQLSLRGDPLNPAGTALAA